jgi:outer membrane protein OmpA-like peptidoglycan-associated protein
MSLVAIGLGATLLLGGCNNVKKADYKTAVDENSELRSRLDEAQASLTDVNEQNAALTTANQQLADENRRLADQVAGTRAQNGADDGYNQALGGGREVVIEMAGDVLFSSGQVTLTTEGKRQLDRVASRLNSEFSGRTIRVEGYTDSDPIRKSGWKTNERLSAERAMAVEEYLVSKGVNKDRIYAAAFGSSQPRGTKSASRRVEIVILAN